MSIFAKPVSQLTTEDLGALRDDGAVENIRLEFKSEVPKKDETLKKLSSFANTFGGYLIVGAKANSSDGRLNALPGVEEQAGYKQKIVQWCFDGVTPPLPVDVSDAIVAPDNPDAFCYVMSVQESDLTPHFLNGRRGVWVRSDEFSQRYEPSLATENEVRHLLDRRKEIRKRLESIRRRSFRRSAQILGPAPGEALDVGFFIGPRFPVRPICAQSDLAPLFDGTRIPWRGTAFPHNRDTLSQHESLLCVPGSEDDTLISIEASIWGTLFYGLRLDPEQFRPGTHAPLAEEAILAVNSWWLVGYLSVFLKHAARLLSVLGYQGALRIVYNLRGLQGLRVVFPSAYGYTWDDAKNVDNEFSFSFECSTLELEEYEKLLAGVVLPRVLFGMNCARHTSANALEVLLAGGRKFNHWN